MTLALLLVGILGVTSVPLVLFACKKKAKTAKQESTAIEITKKSTAPPQTKEVKEWNDKINAGMKRPQKDDETVDDQPTDWGQVQKVDVKDDPSSLKPDSNKVDSKVDEKKKT